MEGVEEGVLIHSLEAALVPKVEVVGVEEPRSWVVLGVELEVHCIVTAGAGEGGDHEKGLEQRDNFWMVAQREGEDLLNSLGEGVQEADLEEVDQGFLMGVEGVRDFPVMEVGEVVHRCPPPLLVLPKDYLLISPHPL